ncbi:uncharacterized protein LOC135604801 [Musa acuminata AAA Group]|uniref:uncharacterized protein LOC135604801 n=1 Tax=Musa acuminata AAA Group TaxID=214697 RepID=UPI0031E10B02
MGLLRYPNPMKAIHKDWSKYYRFHRDYGHDTEDCRDLQNQIEDLIRRVTSGAISRNPGNRLHAPRDPSKDRLMSSSEDRQLAIVALNDEEGLRPERGREKCPRPELKPEITFGAGEVKCSHHDDALVIFIRIAKAQVKRVMIDTRSSADVLYLDAFKKLSLTKEDLTPMVSTLTRFMRDFISPLETTILPITIGEELRAKTIMTTFMVIDLPSAYNVILGRSMLNKLKAVVSTYHRAIKFPTSAGIGESRSDPIESR